MALPKDRGYLVKVGSFEFPSNLIRRETYKSAPAQRQDNDSYVDADGYLHRNPMPHTRAKIEFETIKMRDFMLRDLMDQITANYTNGLERKVHLTYYEEEYGQYIEGDFYLPATMEFQMMDIKTYDQVRFAFIEY